jgi:hypothetical protein
MDVEHVNLLNKVMRLEGELQAKEKESKLLAHKLRESSDYYTPLPRRSVKSASKYKPDPRLAQRKELAEQYSFLVGRLDRKSQSKIKTDRDLTTVRRVGLSRNQMLHMQSQQTAQPEGLSFLKEAQADVYMTFSNPNHSASKTTSQRNLRGESPIAGGKVHSS